MTLPNGSVAQERTAASEDHAVTDIIAGLWRQGFDTKAIADRLPKAWTEAHVERSLHRLLDEGHLNEGHLKRLMEEDARHPKAIVSEAR